ncbi:hypothetical protein DHEL01_v201364 [Diaporthe helianthi]|uniref:Uncharacterized protein n=1 Tax=Diaporthe helianthi TaxID=158607 RepID=A0A2P5ICM3_DIAHE|nr:hypothetical protein DHEL01_v201364 [Diaporthe helianthi]
MTPLNKATSWWGRNPTWLPLDAPADGGRKKTVNTKLRTPEQQDHVVYTPARVSVICFHRCPPKSPSGASLLNRKSRPIQSSYLGSKPDPGFARSFVSIEIVVASPPANRARVSFPTKAQGPASSQANPSGRASSGFLPACPLSSSWLSSIRSVASPLLTGLTSSPPPKAEARLLPRLSRVANWAYPPDETAISFLPAGLRRLLRPAAAS